MADAPLTRSAVFGRLVRCFSEGFDVAFEVFSPELTPLLPLSEDRSVALLRQAVTATEDDTMKGAVSTALRTGASQRVTTKSLVIELRPIRDRLRMAGILAAAISIDDVARAGRRMEAAGEAIQQLLESDVLARRADKARERQYDRWLRLLGFLPGLATEAELIDAFLQALAIWHDLDTYVYVRHVDRTFILSGSLPASRHDCPKKLASEVVEPRWLEHISSVAELERIGWYGPPSDLVLIPLGPKEDATHAIAVRANLDARLKADVLTACRILEVCLDRAVDRDEQRVEEQFSQRLHDVGSMLMPLPALVEQLITDLARLAGAEQGAFSADLPGAPGNGDNGSGEAGSGVSRMLVPLGLPGPSRSLEFTASEAPLTVRNLRLARTGTRAFTHWLLGLNQASQIMEQERLPRAEPGGPHAP
jgi:hypothetical protein